MEWNIFFIVSRCNSTQKLPFGSHYSVYKKIFEKKMSSASPRPKSKMAAQKFENAIKVLVIVANSCSYTLIKCNFGL